MDFEALKLDIKDEPLKLKLTNFHNSIDKIENIINQATSENINQGDNSTYEKINLDIFMTYSLNSLYWLYLRSKGIDPNQNEVKKQLVRIREYMLKAKEAHERKTLRPKPDTKVAKRIVTFYTKDHENKKRKFK